jgi:alpha-L-fucosidase
MKKLLIGLACIIAVNLTVAQNISKDEKMKWWHEAKFGMFIHWGPYAKIGGEYNGKDINN